VFALLLAAFYTVRLLQAACAIGSFNHEEGYTLSAAWQLVSNPIWPYQAYQITDHENGSLIMTLLTAPFCLIFGPSIFALKLPVVLLGGLTMLALLLLGRAVAGPTAGLMVSALYLFAPSPVWPYNLTNHGFHPDVIPLLLFTLLMLHRCRRPGASRRDLLAAGALGGAAIYFAFLAALSVAAFLLAWLWCAALDGGRLRRRIGYIAVGLAMGASPLLAYNLANDFRAGAIFAQFSSEPTEEADGPGQIHGLEGLMTVAGRLSTSYDLTKQGRHLPLSLRGYDAVYWCVVLLAVLWPWVRRWLSRAHGPPGLVERAALLNGLVIPLTLLAVDREVCPKYLVVVIVLFMLPLGIRLAELISRGGVPGKALALVALGAYCFNGAYQVHDEIRLDRLGLALKLDGRSDTFFLKRVTALTDQCGCVSDEAQGYLDKTLSSLRFLSGLQLEERPRQKSEMAKYFAISVEKLREMDLPARRTMLIILGYFNGIDFLSQALVAEGHPRDVHLRRAQWIAEGIGRSIPYNQLQEKISYFESRAPELPAAIVQAYYVGVGHGVARRMIGAVPHLVDRVVPPPRCAAFWQGVEQFNRRTGGSLDMHVRTWLHQTAPF